MTDQPTTAATGMCDGCGHWYNSPQDAAAADDRVIAYLEGRTTGGLP